MRWKRKAWHKGLAPGQLRCRNPKVPREGFPCTVAASCLGPLGRGGMRLEQQNLSLLQRCDPSSQPPAPAAPSHPCPSTRSPLEGRCTRPSLTAFTAAGIKQKWKKPRVQIKRTLVKCQEKNYSPNKPPPSAGGGQQGGLWGHLKFTVRKVY